MRSIETEGAQVALADQAFGAEMGETLAIIKAEHKPAEAAPQVSGVWRPVWVKFGSKPREWGRKPAISQARR